ncbi:hypothetical protein POL88_15565 [Priestia megaterium]|uniref:hypothetical protein n=1 Tax=Priestia megaterium TaxID=1404 RepID=UPI00234EC290|nr:hypothetical protein [Priestia megaterium]MDC7770345.1 hypothetical protein [Priestia megaterium]
MEKSKKISVVSQIIGILVESECSAAEVLEVLKEVKQTMLERSWHISSNKKAD